jgi:uncharacterized protein (TIGR03435 family)
VKSSVLAGVPRSEARQNKGTVEPHPDVPRHARAGEPMISPTVTPGEATDPTGAVSFTDAIGKKLGLKLEMHKRPEPVLVLDHLEEKPTDN